MKGSAVVVAFILLVFGSATRANAEPVSSHTVFGFGLGVVQLTGSDPYLQERGAFPAIDRLSAGTIFLEHYFQGHFGVGLRTTSLP